MTPNILFMIDVFRFRGGTEVHLWELAMRLEHYGYHPIICSLDGEKELLMDISALGVEVWPRYIGRTYSRLGRRTTERIASEANARNVQIVQTYHFKSDWVGSKIASFLGCPHISSRRDMGYTQTLLRRFIYHSINRHVSEYIAPSEAVKESVIEREGIASDRIHVIHNGLDTARFGEDQDSCKTRAELGLPMTGMIVGNTGSFRPVKNHELLIRSWRKVVDSRLGVHLAIVGQGPLENELRRQTRNLNLEGSVTFVEHTNDIPRVLKALDVFVLSSHSEGMSNALLEAMAAGLPVVATDVGGNGECVVHEKTGFLTPPGDASEMARRLGYLLDHPAEAAAMGAAGKERVAALFDIEGMVQRHASLYDSLLNAKSREPARAR